AAPARRSGAGPWATAGTGERTRRSSPVAWIAHSSGRMPGRLNSAASPKGKVNSLLRPAAGTPSSRRGRRGRAPGGFGRALGGRADRWTASRPAGRRGSGWDLALCYRDRSAASRAFRPSRPAWWRRSDDRSRRCRSLRSRIWPEFRPRLMATCPGCGKGGALRAAEESRTPARPDGLPGAVDWVLRAFRQRDLPAAGIDASVPVRICENGWPTGPGRSEEQQARVLETIVRSASGLRAELNVTHWQLFTLRDASSCRG